MAARNYVNLPFLTAERRENSGVSRLYRLVGVSFGLMCVIQSTLNICLRLQSDGFSNRSGNISTSNFSLMSDYDIKALILERDQLLQNTDQLNQDKDRLIQENNRLAREKLELMDINRNLTAANDELNLKTINQQNKIKHLRQSISVSEIRNPTLCPMGWTSFGSSCYELSSSRDTWYYAKQDCEKKGAHLVILNDKAEERAVRFMGGDFKMWIGYSNGNAPLSKSVWLWIKTWMDGTPLTFTNWNAGQSQRWNPFVCAYIDERASCFNSWFLNSCNEYHYWMCEKKQSNLIGPG